MWFINEKNLVKIFKNNLLKNIKMCSLQPFCKYIINRTLIYQISVNWRKFVYLNYLFAKIIISSNKIIKIHSWFHRNEISNPHQHISKILIFLRPPDRKITCISIYFCASYSHKWRFSLATAFCCICRCSCGEYKEIKISAEKIN